MSFRVELIGISLALGTNDIVTGKRSIVVPTPTGQFVDVTHRETSPICSTLVHGLEAYRQLDNSTNERTSITYKNKKASVRFESNLALHAFVKKIFINFVCEFCSICFSWNEINTICTKSAPSAPAGLPEHIVRDHEHESN